MTLYTWNMIPEGNLRTALRLHSIISDLVWKGIRQQLKGIPARPATPDELTMVHQAEYVLLIEAYCRQVGGW